MSALGQASPADVLPPVVIPAPNREDETAIPALMRELTAAVVAVIDGRRLVVRPA